MNKGELIKTLAETKDIHPNEAQELVSEFFNAIKRALLKGDRVEIRGFGSFKVKSYKGYQGRNPRTGEVVEVKPKQLPFFRAGKELKDYINS